MSVGKGKRLRQIFIRNKVRNLIIEIFLNSLLYDKLPHPPKAQQFKTTMNIHYLTEFCGLEFQDPVSRVS